MFLMSEVPLYSLGLVYGEAGLKLFLSLSLSLSLSLFLSRPLSRARALSLSLSLSLPPSGSHAIPPLLSRGSGLVLRVEGLRSEVRVQGLGFWV